jgi:hypothetical protein
MSAPASPLSTIPDAPHLEAPARRRVEEHYWLWVLCLLGLDYFSTLAYQPSITFEVAGRLGPLATGVIVVLTLFGALPVYFYLAGRSPRGHGSLGLLERLVRGWRGKTLVLILLGFAATDFTMLKALSLADAAVHVLNNQDVFRQTTIREVVGWLNTQTILLPGAEEPQPFFDEQLVVTLMLGLLGFCFWFLLRKGFNRNVLFLAVPLVGLYLLLNAVLLGAGLWQVYDRPELVDDWLRQIADGPWWPQAPQRVGGDWGTAALLSFLFLPSLALGLSGFELSMIIMPQVKGKVGESAGQPRTRIRNTRKVLITAALVMSVFLLASVVVTTLLIPPAELAADGRASNRALAYLAHGGALTVGDEPLLPFCGRAFGTLYDVVTVLILCLAGTSVMTALAVLLPQFLLRFGMEFRWVDRWGLMLGFFALINFVVTLAFKANVQDQRAAYATGVLVLLTSAGVVTVLDKKHVHAPAGWFGRLLARLDVSYFSLIAALFVLTTIGVVCQSLSGLAIAFCFILTILAMSVVSRAFRADEARTQGFRFKDEQSKFLWDSLRLADFPALVPHRPGRISCAEKERQIRAEHQLDPGADVVILEIEVGDASEFHQWPLIEVKQEERRFILRATECASVAHTIAAIAVEMSRSSVPPGLHFGWTELDLLSASWSYLAFGEGNIPWKVRELIHRDEPDPAKRPRVIVG